MSALLKDQKNAPKKELKDMINEFEKANKIISEKKNQRVSAVVKLKSDKKNGVTRVIPVQKVGLHLSEMNIISSLVSPKRIKKHNAPVRSKSEVPE